MSISDWMNGLHDWQKDGFVKVLTKCNRTETHNIIPVNASVGSGKTFFGSLSIADFIDLHKNEKTIQIFVTPRIKLCAQQSKELIEKITTCEPFNYQKFEEFSGNGSPFQVIPVDCTHREWSRFNDNLTVQHAVFIICDESLWGEDKMNPGMRWNNWMHRFNAWKKAGYIFGNIIFDEAHNFGNDEKVKKMFGTTLFKKHMNIDYVNKKCLLTYFQNVILLSGTPAVYQADITKAFPKNVCECPLNLAIQNGWVERPVLNLVSILASDLFSTGIVKVLEHEVNVIKPANGVRLLVNFGSIPEIDEFENDDYILNHMGKDFHFITIHSTKNFKTKELNYRECKSMVNGNNYNSSDVYDLLEGLDSGYTENEKMQSVLKSVLDGKPIMVGQVQMIGEGINIRSFNSVITKSNYDTTAMQQIGRVLRKYNGKKLPNVYCVYDNVNSLTNLLANLMVMRDLTADCFDWGKRIDIIGKGYAENDDSNEDELKERSNIGWKAIDPDTDPDISEIQYSDAFKNTRLSKNFKSFAESDIFEDLANEFADEFSMADLQLIAGTLKRSNNATGDSKQLKVKGNRGRKKKAIEAVKNVDVITSTSSVANENNSAMVTSSSSVTAHESQESTNEDQFHHEATLNGRSAIIEIVKTIRGYVLKHKNNDHIMKVIKEHPECLIEFEFSYIPTVSHKIVNSGLCSNSNFLKVVELI